MTAAVRSLALALCLPGAALAGPEQADRHQRAAVGHFKAGRFDEAAAAYEQAFAADPHPTHLLNLAHVHGERPGGCGDVLAAYQRYFEMCADRPCDLAEVAERRRSEARARCIGVLEVHTAPPGASVRVDDVDRGTTPVTLELLADVEHRLAVTLAEHEPITRPLALKGGATVVLELALQPTPTAEPLVAPDATVAAAPVTPPVTPAASASADDAAWRRPTGWALLGAGALAVGAGVWLSFETAATLEEAGALAPGEVSRHRELGEDLRWQNAGLWAGYGLGAALVTAGVWVLLDAGGEAAGPTVGAGHRSVSVRLPW